MSENNLPNLDGNNEELENQAAENEAAEAEAAAVEAEGYAEETAEFAEDETDVDYDYNNETPAYDAPAFAEEAAPVQKNHTAAIVIGVVAALVLIVAGLLVWYITKPLPQPTYVDINGQTIGDMASSMGMTMDEVIYMYDLPKNLSADTSISQVQYMIPLKRMAVMNQMGLEMFKEQYGIPDEITGQENFLDNILKVFGINRYKITGDTPFGLAEGEILLKDYVGEENLEDFKAEFGLGDEITLDTKWKEVRDTVMNKQKEEYEEQQAQMNAAAEEAAQTEEPAETEGTDASAEPAEETPAAE